MSGGGKAMTTMRRAVLILDHGSRRDDANVLVATVAEQVRARRPELHVVHAHMELAEPSFHAGVAACVAAGATEIVVHPYFLGAGRHTLETIPALVSEARQRHPQLSIRVGAHLGLHEKLVEVVLERIDEAIEE